MALKTYNTIKASMAVCLADASRIMNELNLEPSSEDIRAAGIAMFIEVQRTGIEPSDQMRFVSKCYDLAPVVGDYDFKTTLADFGDADNPAQVIDLDVMKKVMRELLSLVPQEGTPNEPATPPANPGEGE
jgi:hypothetical protein